MLADMPPRIQTHYEMIVDESAKYNLDPALIAAIIFQESGGKEDAREYSRGYPYVYKPTFFAKMHGIAFKNELEGQRTSYGLMQIKCATARDIGYLGKCQKLFNASLNLKYGVKYLSILKRRYKSDLNMISAYNQGQPFRFSSGKFKNHSYVNSVLNLRRRFKVWF